MSQGNGHGFAVARPGQATSQDAVRWGDTKSLVGILGTNLKDAVNRSQSQGRQLVTAHWKWPMTWRCLFVAVPAFDAGETGELDVIFNVTVGCGGGMITFPRTLVLLPNAAGIYDPVIDDLLILPAQDIQIELALVSTTDGKPFAGPGALTVGAYVAPETESHALAHILDCLCQSQEGREGGWMPPGFFPTPLQYGR